MAVARPEDWRNPDYTAVYRERKQRLDRVRESDNWELLLRYYADGNYVDFIEDWLVTYDPRNVNKGRPAYSPFVLFTRQRECVAWMQDRFESNEDGILEKSRDGGASWMALAFALTLWRFKAGVKISFGSRKEDLVDKLGQPDSLLEKVRIMLRMLPPELLPSQFSTDKHAKFMEILNPENGASITGEAGNNIGRGGRSSLYFLDEAAFIEHPDKVEAALSGNTDCRIDVSTPNGKGNPFYRKRFGGRVPVFTLHWRDDPRKGEEWYSDQVERLEPRILAQEVDLDYEASGEESTIPAEWVRSSQNLRRWLEEHRGLPDVTHYLGVAGMDVGGGRSNSVFVPVHGPVVGRSTYWKDPDSINTAARGRELAIEASCKQLNYDEIGVGKGVTAAFKRMRRPTAYPINVGSSATNRRWPDGKMAKDKFKNLKAELWWTARDRLRKSHELWLHVQGRGGRKRELDEVLLLPEDPRLASELSVPGYTFNDSGKIVIERKEALERRGVPSPDFADALMLALAPAPGRVRAGRTTGHY